MTIKTKSETIFEQFCKSNKLQCEKIPEGEEPTPDYKIVLKGQTVIVEIKQIDEDNKFTEEGNSRIVGNHVRAKINEARKQLRTALKKRLPAILLIYNNLDPMQLFGTEQHDFITAMYGEITIAINPNNNSITDSFHGRNQYLRKEKNTSFSAIGLLYQSKKGPAVRIYENVFAENILNYTSLPKCIEAIRVDISKEQIA